VLDAQAVDRRGQRITQGARPAEGRDVRLARRQGNRRHGHVAGQRAERADQLPIGYESKATTGIYIKQQWRETAQPNMVSMEGENTGYVAIAKCMA
jgi:hypothetical protein